MMVIERFVINLSFLNKGEDIMWDRPWVLTEQGVDNLIAIFKKWEKNPPPPIPDVPLEFASEEMIKKLFEDK